MLKHRGVRLQQDVNGRDRSGFGGKDGLPVVLHADNSPVVLLRLIVKRLREGTQFDVWQSLCRTVSVFTRRIVVKNQKLEPSATAALRVLQHRPVADGITDRHERPAADLLVDADGFSA